MKLLIFALGVYALLQVQAAAYTLDWNFNETTGRVAHDQSTNHFDGDVHGATWQLGVANDGLHFNGATDFVAATNSQCLTQLSSYKTGTISVSFRLNSLPLNTVFPIFYYGNPTGSSGSARIGNLISREASVHFSTRC